MICTECWGLIFDFNFDVLTDRYETRLNQWTDFCGEVFVDESYGESSAWCQRKPHTQGKHKYVWTAGGAERIIRWPMETA